jgi:opacity protein-like surface antigen
MQARVIAYVGCVLLLALCCSAQTTNTQPAVYGPSQLAQVVPAQDAGQGEEATLFELPTADTLGTTTGDASGTGTGKQPKSPNAPPWEWASGVSVGLGYSSTTGSPGIGGLNVGGGWRWKEQLELATDMDFGNETTVLSGIVSKSTRQNYLFGGRYYIRKAIIKNGKFEPFGHLMYGISHESVKTTEGIPVTSTISTSETSWAWDFGGGVDYLLSKNWALRGRVDWLKTHFNELGQSHFKWVAGFWYSFSSRKPIPVKP